MDPALQWRDIAARLQEKRFAGKTLATLYLDQAFLAGNGNYLRSEVLHRAKLHPLRKPRDLSRGEIGTLSRETLAISRRSYNTGGITLAPRLEASLRHKGAKRGQRRFYVFGRAGLPCYSCGTAVDRLALAGRRVYLCPGCQSA